MKSARRLTIAVVFVVAVSGGLMPTSTQSGN
jgi:hypothetical protein